MSMSGTLSQKSYNKKQYIDKYTESKSNHQLYDSQFYFIDRNQP